ncbi:MAG: hypothetical protein NTW87_31435 [Planctomycetota bacterium]|nr:hypothetical protein [Planctomycetota bacterium]
MATNFSDLGFAAEGGAELEALARKCLQNGRARRCTQGAYLEWAVGNGIELWAQVNAQDELIGLNPHFAGKTRARIGLTHRISRSGFPMEGGFRAWARPDAADPTRGACPFVFDAPEFLLHEDLSLPVVCSAQLTAFAQQCVLFADETEFRQRAARSTLSLTPESLLPLGLFGKDGQPLAEPLASAMVCGFVLDAIELTNPSTKGQFWWLKVRNAAGEVDVVADVGLLPHGARPHSLLQCTAWLSGKVAGADRSR